MRADGGSESVNYVPITEGWSYMIRMYQPRKEILDGSWTFPSIQPVQAGKPENGS